MPDKITLIAHDTKKAYTVESNEVQKALWHEWKRMVRRVRGMGGVDVLCCVGDLVDGVNKKGHGFGLWTTSLLDQADIAIAMLDMIKYKRVVGVNGSNYHVGNNLSIDGFIIDKMGGGVRYRPHDRD